MGGISIIALLCRLFGQQAKMIESIRILPSQPYTEDYYQARYHVTINNHVVELNDGSGYPKAIVRREDMNVERLLGGSYGCHLMGEEMNFQFPEGSSNQAALHSAVDAFLAPKADPAPFRMSATLEDQIVKAVQESAEKDIYELMHINREQLSQKGMDLVEKYILSYGMKSKDPEVVLDAAYNVKQFAKDLFKHFLLLNPSMELRLRFISYLADIEYEAYMS